MSPFKTLLQYPARHKTRIAIGLTCVLAANVLKGIGPLIVQRAVDSVTQRLATPALTRYAGLMVILALVQGVLLVLQEWALFGLARCVEHDLRSSFYERLQKLPPEFYHLNRTGDLMARATNDVSAAAAGTGHSLIYIVNTIFALIVLLPLMTKLSGKLTAITFVPLLLVICATLVLKPLMKTSSRKLQDHFGMLSNRLQEVILGLRTIRAFTREESEIEKFRQVNSQYTRQTVRNIRLVWLMYPLLQFLMGFAYIGVLWYGGGLISKGQLSTGQFLQFSLYVGYLWWPMHELGSAINIFQRAIAAMTRICAVMNANSDICDSSDAVSIPEIKGNIEFQDLTVTYVGARQPALKQVSVQIHSGETVALAGPVGSGKSTFMNMIPRMFDADSGHLLLDGYPVRKLSLDKLRSCIGYVPQEPFLFNRSIAANIAFGKETATREEIEKAAAQADIADEIAAFPQGYETIVGEQGVLLSGGQRQRISIARALIRDPEVLLLDNAFSAIDAETEEKILKHLRDFMPGRTCVISSHRLSTLRTADRIVVLDKGRTAEQGTHLELMDRKGIYERIYREQLLQDEVIAS
jgi:ATP-binding cassette subfamily B multidrug efflux pump